MIEEGERPGAELSMCQKYFSITLMMNIMMRLKSSYLHQIGVSRETDNIDY